LGTVNNLIKPKKFYIYVQLLTSSSTSTPVSALIDSGSDESFIDEELVQRLKISRTQLPHPIEVVGIDGRPLGSGLVKEQVSLNLACQNANSNHYVKMSCKLGIIRSPECPIILGLPWLRTHRPTFDWSTETLKFNSELVNPILVPNSTSFEPGPLESSPSEVTPVPTIENHTEETSRIQQVVEHAESPKIDNNDNCQDLKKDFEDDWNIDLDEDVSNNTTTTELPPQFADFKDVFDPKQAEELPMHRPGFDISIDLLPGTTPPFGPIYPLSPDETELTREYIEKNKKRGFIRESRSSAGAPIFFVGKPSEPGKPPQKRLVVNYQGLDKLTLKFRYPLPLIPELLDRLCTAKIFTKIDLRSAYHLLRVKEGDEWKTAFRTKYGLFEYLVMPFGLANAPACFQRFVEQTFRDMINVFVVLYLDDFLIFSEDESQHDTQVRAVLQRLRETKLYAKLEKCQFGVRSIKFLGHWIDSKGIACNQEKVKALLEWPIPKSKRQLQRFLGLANYFRKFVNEFSKIATPLHRLLRKDVFYSWSNDCQAAFETLKNTIASTPVLKHPDPNEPFWVETDASNFALGCVLLQKDPDGALRACAYYSRALNAAERNYCIYDKELLAIKVALEEWRHHLEGSRHKIIVYSDHKGLETIANRKVMNQRHARWSLVFKNFNFAIKYRPGSENSVADALSRRPDYQPSEEEPLDTEQQLILEPNVVQIAAIRTRYREFTERLKEALPHDGFYQSQLSSNSVNPFILIEGVPHFQNRIYVPEGSLRTEALVSCHDSTLAGHLGVTKTQEMVTRKFYWPHMDKTIEEFCAACQTCARNKLPRHAPYGLLMPLPIPEGPWISIAMDFMTDLPNSEGMTTILTITDRFTKMAHFVAMPKLPDAEETAAVFIKEVVRLHGLPKSIISDRGSQFISHLWKRMLELLRIQSCLSSAYHPESNGQSERTNQTLQQYLRCFTSYQQDDWFSLLPLAEFTFNNSVSASTGFTPFYANSGYHPRFEFLSPSETRVPAIEERLRNLNMTHEQLKVNLAKAQLDQKEHADAHRKKHPTLQPGDLVWLNARNIVTSRPSKKLDYKRLGPFEVIRSINDVAYELRLPPSMHIHPIFHVSLLGKATINRFTDRQHPEPPPILVEGQEEFQVQGILDSRIIRSRLFYLIDWLGYPPSERAWIDSDEIHAADLIRIFHEKYPEKPCPQDLDSVLEGGDVRD
jgi:transposase InsO family protein